MPWESVTLTPGANVERTATQNQTGYLETQNARFKDGLFQKLGGWVKYINAVFSGVPRSLWGWQDLNNVKRLSLATTETLTVIADGVPQVITPQTLDTSVAPDFSTTITSRTVEIVDTDTAGLTTDVVVELLTPVSVGGIILSGNYQIVGITGADSYEIDALSPATATEASGGVVPEFVTTAGSASVAVNLPDHGQVKGQTVVFPIPTTVGGVIIQGKYTVTAVNSVNQFTITGSASAIANDTQSMNGGEVAFRYYIAIGPVPSGVGFGVGPFGEGAYGKGTSSTGVQTGIPITATDWTQDNWGEILLACPEGGGIYFWQPNTGFQNAALIGSGPLHNDGMFISMAQQQVIAWASSVDARIGGGIGIYQDPLLLQWCTIGNFLEWSPDPNNFARNYRVPTGSKIVSAMASKNRNLAWTDLDVYAGTFNGGNSVYSWNRVGSNCGLIGKHAWGQLADTVFWMGYKNFFSYSGSGVGIIPCSVWDEVFEILNPTFQHRVMAGSNTDFNEIWFEYPDMDSLGYPNRMVKYNTVENTWDFMGPVRVAWFDRSVLGNPIAATEGGVIYRHESGFDDDGSPIRPQFQTGDFFIDQGEEFVFIDEVFPDFKWGQRGGSRNAQIQISLLCRDDASSEYREYGPFLVTSDTPSFQPANPDGTRVRTRQVALRVWSTDVGSFWRLGRVRFRYAPDGRR